MPNELRYTIQRYSPDSELPFWVTKIKPGIYTHAIARFAYKDDAEAFIAVKLNKAEIAERERRGFFTQPPLVT